MVYAFDVDGTKTFAKIYQVVGAAWRQSALYLNAAKDVIHFIERSGLLSGRLKLRITRPGDNSPFVPLHTLEITRVLFSIPPLDSAVQA